MRVALGQIDMIWENRDASISHSISMIEEASKNGADVIIFPEMSFTGFSMNAEGIAEDFEHSVTLERMKALAVKYGIAIGFGLAVKEPAGCEQEDKMASENPDANKDSMIYYNYFSLVDKEGEVVSHYAKMHPFTYGGETDVYQKGARIVSVPFLGRHISLFICYDLRFPEIFQIASSKSDIMFVIANWPAVRREHWKTLLRARAIETQSYVVGVNTVGNRDNTEYSGDSMAVDAIGNILGELPDREGVLIVDLEDRAWSLRNKFNTREDRREQLYASYFESEDI